MDETVYDMSQQTNSNPNIFIKKDWVSILDNQNGVYSGNQCVIDTSQLSNSNKWMNYSESYLAVPLLLTLGATTTSTSFLPNTAANSCDYALSLKNWYGSVIHSISVDLNGATVIQQTGFQSLWNTFKLMTTLSYNDLLTFGPTIGFYPDTSSSFEFYSANTASGRGVCNNKNGNVVPVVTGAFNALETFNKGFYERQKTWNFDPDGNLGTSGTDAFKDLTSQTNLQNMYKSHIFKKVNGTASVNGMFQVQIMATIFLRHLHSFFDKLPLCKGIFLKMTLMLNNCSVQVKNTVDGSSVSTLSDLTVNNPIGGINPIMMASAAVNHGAYKICADSSALTLIANLSVGMKCLDSNLTTAGAGEGAFARNITLNIPAYTFNPVFESAYVSNPIIPINYTDIYQFQVVNQTGNINSLISNGIAGLKSVLVLPFFTATSNNGVTPLLSPYCPDGGGTTSPMAYLNNFNVVISGQNAIYNSERYTYEHFINQLYGQNSVNGNQMDGINSGLISQSDFENCYCYYYVNVERCLPIEKNVTKSVNIIGTSVSAKNIDLYVFCEYNCSINLNVLLGVRV